MASSSLGIADSANKGQKTHRQCTIEFNNLSSHSLMNPRMHVSSGSCTTSLPDEIGSSKEATAEFKKTPQTVTGTVGVFTYELRKPRSESHTKILAVIFSVPYDYGLYSNWYAAGFFDKNKACDQDLFNEMYYNSENGFARQKAGSLISHSDGDFTVTASMTDTYTPVMTVEIRDNN